MKRAAAMRADRGSPTELAVSPEGLSQAPLCYRLLSVDFLLCQERVRSLTHTA